MWSVFVCIPAPQCLLVASKYHFHRVFLFFFSRSDMRVCIGTAIPDLSRFADRRTLGVPSSCRWALRNRSMSIPACCRTACTIWPQFAASFPGSVSWWTPYCLLASCQFTWRPSSQVLASSTRLSQSQVILLKSSETCDLCFFFRSSASCLVSRPSLRRCLA